ncbi:hypothetical protein M413DRAFT_23715 [Hebeloma cylindrosporum]|uniref:HBS1-like protein N-terminal domain-containing protein n=1 Tax=Hebeloma cylindrosporum TaxID=76867 RepID=A0A0C3CP79_HEBCY|nr:hypothetical protein M413DRAFT_23715 [Hebeloma cylindrosporum h7]
MSRHRDVRSLNIQDELDDDALSDGGEGEITPEQEGLHETQMLESVRAECIQAQMNDGLEQVRLIIGGEDVSELSDNSIKDALWEYYFDVEKTIQWSLEERERRNLAKERKGTWNDHNSDSLSDEQRGNESYQYYQSNQSGHLQEGEYLEENTRPRVPSIFLAQEQPGFDNQAYLAVPSSPKPNRLSTITERTERTEPSMLWRPRQQYTVPNTPRSMAPSTTTSYGQEIVDWSSAHEVPLGRPDPNTGRTSPSGSAIQRLSTYDPPPSNSSTISPDNRHYPESASHSHRSPNLHTDANFDTKSKEGGPPLMQPSYNKPQSKLSKLASSRASSISTRSESSRSSGTAVTGSIKTFPALRPSAQSERPPSSIASSKDLPDIPAQTEEATDQSSTSSIVRRAIQTALQLEAVDNDTIYHPETFSGEICSFSPISPTLEAELACSTKGCCRNRSLPQSLSSPSSPSQISTTRPLSKLAMLAQQKIDASRVPKLPKTTTEYLTPIANGSSVTTAITTSYQSLYSLTDPSRRNTIPRLDVVPVQPPGGILTSPSHQRPSKLAMKIKRAGDKPLLNPGFPSEDAIVSAPLSPLFQPTTTHARASPSAFASVLIYDAANSPCNEGKDKNSKKRKEHMHKKEGTTIAQRTSDQPLEQRIAKPRNYAFTDNNTFAFDGPSPDDIIFNARKKSGLKNLASPASHTSPNASAPSGKSLSS